MKYWEEHTRKKIYKNSSENSVGNKKRMNSPCSTNEKNKSQSAKRIDNLLEFIILKFIWKQINWNCGWALRDVQFSIHFNSLFTITLIFFRWLCFLLFIPPRLFVQFYNMQSKCVPLLNLLVIRYYYVYLEWQQFVQQANVRCTKKKAKE